MVSRFRVGNILALLPGFAEYPDLVNSLRCGEASSLMIPYGCAAAGTTRSALWAIYGALISCQPLRMFRSVEMPLWLLILIVAFAAVTFASHFLFPSVRWFFRRRMERVVAQLNTRLARPIEPFKLLRRHDTIQRLIYDPQVVEAVVSRARETGVREDVVFEQVRRYAREIVPSFSATAYFGFATRAAKLLSRAFYRVRLGHFDEAAISAIGSDATVVFVMNHRSNMDYVLVTYLAAERSALSYAAGEWARVWPLGRLVRAMGAYFIRRKSRSALYRRVLARYVQMATQNGVAQAVFPEGGLSLTGAIGEAKLGLLSYIISDFKPDQARDVAFVPVAINYDRVLEDRVLVAAATDTARKFRFRWRDASRYFVKHLFQRLTGRFVRYGYAAVSFGAPLSLADYVKGRQGDLTGEIAAELMGRIKAIVPVLPIPLVAACLIEQTGPVTQDKLKTLAAARLDALRKAGAHTTLFSDDIDLEVENAVVHLRMRQILKESPAGLSVNPADRPLLAYYAASIGHLDPK